MAEKNEQAAAKLFAAGKIPYSEWLLAQRENKMSLMKVIADWKELCSTAWILSCHLGKQEK